ncbi:phage shock protein C [Sphingomonas sp. SORGH_AS802]|jgi:phage shock protein C|uniref:envelope stress response membrane protein PspC n=1 Tax=unclassified Sphingomonas TaxID=196159 RepID=UPI0028656DDA|nr:MULTISPECIES: envelope stress response membrane protein PspC [unclassified Sphingomonas]MDR6127563.1 phage shock protein C [Sphingomonas sp. SORGH_AS_0438]MDR6133525.1 phage shock protein C [Sphingomonas sp. SORGH_AS_0802]
MAARTQFYLNKQDAKYKGVCAGIADYTGIEVLWVRIALILLTLAGGFPWTLIAYGLIAWMAQTKPIGLYQDAQDQKFWQGVRANPTRSTAEVRSKLRDIDRRLADMETHFTSRNSALAKEIDSLR